MSIRLAHITDLHLGDECSLPPPYLSKLGECTSARELSVALSDAIGVATRQKINDAFGPARTDPTFQTQELIAILESDHVNFKTLSSHDPNIWEGFVEWWTDAVGSGAVDGLICTGDVARTGQLKDMRRAAELILAQAGGSADFVSLPYLGQRDGAFNGAYLGLSSISVNHVALLPGNHDRYADETGMLGAKTFDAHFASHWTGNRLMTRYIEKVGHRRVAIICFESNLEFAGQVRPNWMLKRYGMLAQGTVEPVLDQLRLATKECQARGELVLWATHHPPVPRANSSHFYTLHGEKELLDLAGSLNVPLILGGHHHEPQTHKDMRSGPTVFVGPTLCEYGAEGAGFVVLEISAPPGSDVATLSLETFTWEKITPTELPGWAWRDKENVPESYAWPGTITHRF